MSNFLILSLKHSEGQTPTFWRADDAGYTTIPFAAGIYPEEKVKANPGYYNNGYDTLAIPFNNAGLESIGLECTIDLNLVASLKKQILKQVQNDDKDNAARS